MSRLWGKGSHLDFQVDNPQRSGESPLGLIYTSMELGLSSGGIFMHEQVQPSTCVGEMCKYLSKEKLASLTR